LDDGIGDNWLPVFDVPSDISRWSATFSRFVNRTEAAIVILRQSLWVDRGDISINSDSWSQSSADSLASSAPNNSATAAMNAENSRSAK
jgi:hypothetical protein